MSKLPGRLLFVLLALGAVAFAPAASEGPDFKEVLEVLRTHSTLDDAQVNRAALDGLLEKISTHAWLIDPSKSAAPDTNIAPVSSSAIFDEQYGYVRVGRVSSHLPAEFALTLDRLLETNKLKGLVIDLRYANGADYDAAVRVADRFLASEQPLLDWGEGMAKSTDKTNAFRQPVAILVNRFTTGAAEALAGVLRFKDIGLLIGTNTAGQASITRDFTLKTGQTLRVAVASVKAGDGAVIERLTPDIQVDVSPEDERAYFVDAYKTMPRLGATNVASLSVTNRPRRRINEAELVRMLREGENPEDESARPARSATPAKPTITDPALARAIDLLKALAVVRHTRS